MAVLTQKCLVDPDQAEPLIMLIESDLKSTNGVWWETTDDIQQQIIALSLMLVRSLIRFEF